MLGCLIASLLVTRGASAEKRVNFRPEWRRAATWEYVATGLLLGTALTLRFTNTQTSVNWRGGVGFDDAVLDRVAIQNLDDRAAMSLASNIVFGGSIAYRVVDSTILPLLVYGDPELALQLSITDAEALSTTGFVVFGSQAFVVRERPFITRGRCDDPETRERVGSCDPGSSARNRSFLAGHVATVMTATGLTCVHHSKLPLYGGGVADVIPCVAMFGATAFTVYSRAALESHYPSDILLGLALGAAAGWAIPLGLRYGFGGSPAAEIDVSVVPWFGREQSGLTLVGSF